MNAKASVLLLVGLSAAMPMAGYSASGEAIPVMSSTTYNQLPYEGKREVYRSAIKHVLVQITQDQSLKNTYREAAKKALNEVDQKLRPVDIYGYNASNTFFLPDYQGAKTGLIVLLNSPHQKPYIHISNQSDLGLLNTGTFKENFSSYNLSDGSSYSGVNTALNGFATGSGGWTSTYFNYYSAGLSNTFYMSGQLIDRLKENTQDESNFNWVLDQRLENVLERSALGEYMRAPGTLDEEYIAYHLDGKDVSMVKQRELTIQRRLTILPPGFENKKDWISENSANRALWINFYHQAKNHYDQRIVTFLKDPENPYSDLNRAYARPRVSSKFGYGYKIEDRVSERDSYFVFANSIGQVSVFRSDDRLINGQIDRKLTAIYTQVPEFKPKSTIYDQFPALSDIIAPGAGALPYPLAPLIITAQTKSSGESSHLNNLVSFVNRLMSNTGGFDSNIGPLWGDDLARTLNASPGNITLQTKYNAKVTVASVATQNFVNALRFSVPHMGPNNRAIIKLSVLDSSAAGVDLIVVAGEHSSDQLISTTLEWSPEQQKFMLPRVNGYLDTSKVVFTHRSTIGGDAGSPDIPLPLQSNASLRLVGSVLTAVDWNLNNPEALKAAATLSIFGKVPLIGHIATGISLAAGTADNTTHNETSSGWKVQLGTGGGTDLIGGGETGSKLKHVGVSAGAAVVFQVLY